METLKNVYEDKVSK